MPFWVSPLGCCVCHEKMEIESRPLMLARPFRDLVDAFVPLLSLRDAHRLHWMERAALAIALPRFM